MYEDRTQNYDSEIHEENFIHDTPFPLPHHIAMCRLHVEHSYKHN